MGINLFGWALGKPNVTKEAASNTQSFVLPQKDLDDGAITITQGAYFGTYVDLEGSVRNELELISRYREMSLHPECSEAINEIVTEAVTQDSDDGDIVDINLDKLNVPDAIKTKITKEFKTIKKLLNFSALAEELFRRWYIDGRLYYHAIVDTDKPAEGVKELRFIDPRKIRKVREVMKTRDPRTQTEVIKSTSEYYVFNERGLTAQSYTGGINSGVRIAPDSIIQVTSGLLDAKSTMVISWLHKAIKALNQLRMIEDAIVIYRLSRAPERRIFYIDVGNLPKIKAEQYLRDIMAKYRNKLVYDASTGEIRDERKHLSMLEDFWLPRREGGRGTEITTLPAGQNLGQLEDVQYFQKKLYKSLNVPIGRLDSENAGGGLQGIGRAAEITRDEVKFFKFVARLRAKFAQLFNFALRIQCVLKGICTLAEWDEFKEYISYVWTSDSNFTELRDMELWRERLQVLGTIDPFLGKYFSLEWVEKNILQRTEEEITEMRAKIQEELDAGLIVLPPPPTQVGPDGMPMGMPPGQDIPSPGMEDPGLQNQAMQSLTPGLDADLKNMTQGFPKSGKKKP
jgi:hypothetical protein